MKRVTPRMCEVCRALVVQDGDCEVYVGTQLVHLPAVCGRARQRVMVRPRPDLTRAARRALLR